MDTDSLRARLIAVTRHKSLREIARRSGVPRQTAQAILYGTTANPRINTYTKLVAILDELEHETACSEQ